MTKRKRLVGLDPRLDEALARYAAGHGLSFTAAISVLAARGLKDEGITIKGDGNDETDP